MKNARSHQQGRTLGAVVGRKGWSDFKGHVAKMEKEDKEAKRKAKAEKKRKRREQRQPVVSEKLKRHQERR